MKTLFPSRSVRTLCSLVAVLVILPYLLTSDDASRPGAVDRSLRAAPVAAVGADTDHFAFSADGKTLAGVDDAGRIMLWDVASAQNRFVFPGHFADSIKQIAFSPDGKALASLGEEFIELWDTDSGQGHSTLPVENPGWAHHLVFSPNGLSLAVFGQSADIAVWDLPAGSVRALASGHAGTVNAAAFSRVGTDLATVAADGRVRIWSLARGQERSTFSGKASGPLMDVLFNPDGKVVATAGSDSAITLWNRRTGVARQLFRTKGDGRTPAMVFSADGKLLASVGLEQQVAVWDVASAQPRWSLPLEPGIRIGTLMFSADEQFLAGIGSDHRIRVWDLSSGTLSHVLEGQLAPIVKAAFVQGQDLLGSVAQDGRVIVWEVSTGAQHLAWQAPVSAPTTAVAAAPAPLLASPPPPATSASKGTTDQAAAAGQAGAASAKEKAKRASEASSRQARREKRRARDWKGIVSIAVSPDGRYFGIAGSDGNIRLLDARFKERFRQKGHRGLPAAGIAFSPNGKRVISVGRDTGVSAWDNANGKKERTSFGHEHPIRTVAVSPDGKFIATGAEETRVFLWDAETGKLLKILNAHADFVNCVAFSPDGQLLASGDADSRILLWDVPTGKLVRTLLGHWDEVNSVAFSPDGRRLASGSVDSRILLWDVASGLQLRSLNGHQGAVRTVAFSPDGSKLFSAGEDKRILDWNGVTGELLDQVGSSTSPGNTLVVTPDGMVVIGDDDNRVTEWDPKRRGKRQSATFAPEPRADSSVVPPSPIDRLVDSRVAVASTDPSVPGRSRPATESRWGDVVGHVLDWLIPAAEAADIPPGPGGPILLVKSSTSPYSAYYAEILRTEGFNEFAEVDIGSVTANMLNQYDVAILAPVSLTASQVDLFSTWVNGDATHPGGNLIAMKPDPQLAALLGLGAAGSTLTDGYLRVASATAAGSGIVDQTMQFHGTADRYVLSGASSIATLYSDAATATENPAVTLHSVGSHGGQAAAFTYDLARSIVYTRQGNPAWAAQERDGFPPIRSDDMFYGASSTQPAPDWVDFAKIAIPQADEQQRLLANLILQMNLAKKPLPRFWYFPRGFKAVVIMTGDDHANNGTVVRFNQFIAASPPGCSVENWECIRGTSYIFPNGQLSNAQAAAFHAQGFEVGLHINTGCADFTPTTLRQTYSDQLASFASTWPSVPAPITQRHHCIAWSDWATGAVVQSENNIRLDTSYYFWPPSWVQDRPGFFSGSGMPMRFANLDGSLIDVFHVTTQMTDESGQTYPFTINTLLDRAIGAEGYYGAFTINAHTDAGTIPESDAVLASAPARGVPIVSSKQMLDWLDARNGSSFGSFTWNGTSLGFTVTAGTGATGLRAMLPANSAAGVLIGITNNSGSTPTPVEFSVETIKGIAYGVFAAATGSYTAVYGADQTAPTVTNRSPAPGANGVDVGTSVTATFSESIDPSTLGSNFELRNGSTGVAAAVAYNASTRTATLTPSASLAPATLYTATIKGGSNGVKDLAGNALAADVTWTFTSGEPPCVSVPCSVWSSSTVPGNASVNDPGSVELGVKFRSDTAGYVSGVRFYQANPGTYQVTLWTAAGQSLASAQVTATAGGWQQANFAAPVPIAAGTVYVASYFAPNGNYAADGGYFASQAVSNGPVTLLQDGVSGGNGVYAYGPSSAFPSNSYSSSNYWVDVVFTTSAPADATPPEIIARSPSPGATNVSTGSAISVTFSEALTAASVDASTIQLRDASDSLLAATVTYSDPTRIATLMPNVPLANGATLTVLVKGGASGVKDLAGNPLIADASWSFTTAAQSGQACSGATASLWPTNPAPSIITDPDTSSVELGVKFRSSVSGVICGIRFYKGPSNGGIHQGRLWNSNGELLATADFQNETASGWQQVNFASPVPVQANTVYVASYLAPVGRYSADSFYFGSIGVTSGPLYALNSAEAGGNGVYQYGAGGFPTDSYQASNYWVDVVFSSDTGPDTAPPTVASTNPMNGASGTNPSGPVAATFSEAMDAGSIGSTTFELRRSDNNDLVAAAVAYASATNTATLTPTAALGENTAYTARILSGSGGVKDAAGNPLLADYTWSFTTGVDPCSTGGNPIVCENGKPGSPSAEWDITGAGDASIQGFATDISVNRGGTIGFKVDTPSTNYRLDIYRMGYYAGNGARKITTVQPSASLPQNQPNCLTNGTTGLIDCGNWALSASWAVPVDAVSGIYFAKAVREDGASAGLASHIVFIVRDDDSTADLVFQTSDTTWQAYNTYGGNSLYIGSPAGRAYKVSYNRPFNTRAVDNGQDWVFSAEYPMVRWLEANGYNISYVTGVDVDRYGSGTTNVLSEHKVFLSVGHDEYWSGQQRANVEAARDGGLSLAFFSGNEVFWKTRWENSIDASGTAYRTMVCYKETHANAKIDPTPTWTGTWRDPRFSPPADGGRPENALSGTIFTVNDGATTSITVPAADGQMRFWRNTPVATLAPGASATLPNGTLGYEWDEDLDNGFRPSGLIRLSTTIVPGAPVLQDYGSTYGSDTANHALTLYRAGSGALVFGAGTVQWTWGLDATHDRSGTPADPRMQQATVNLFADMGAQPGTLQSGLVSATASTDTSAPTSTIVSPADGSTVQPGTPVTITGTATDAGGGAVGGVEISVDGGATWHPATGRGDWTYQFTAPNADGQLNVRSRAVDDSLNLESAGGSIVLNVGTGSDTQAPTAPGNLGATVTSGTQITLTWTASTDNVAVSGYRVERCEGAACATFDPVGTSVAATFADGGLVEGTSYSYRVRAVDAANNLSPYSGVVSATPDGTAPSAPTDLSVATTTATQINLNWTASTDNVAVTGYRVERCQGAGCASFTEVASVAQASYADSGLTAGTSYSYRVRAVDAVANFSGFSAVASASTQSVPAAVNDTFLYVANVTRSVPAPGVLANDSDPAGLPLTAQQVGSLSGGGTLNFSTDGTFTYFRSANSNTVSFRYRANNGAALSEPATGATVNLRVDAAPSTVGDNCTYDRSENTVVTQPQRCTVIDTRVVTMDVASNDTDSNVTTNVPTDGVGLTVVRSSALVTAVGTGVTVSANPDCGQDALGVLATKATITNNCDGTVTVSMLPTNTSNITYAYTIADDLGKRSGARSVTLSSQR